MYAPQIPLCKSFTNTNTQHNTHLNTPKRRKRTMSTGAFYQKHAEKYTNLLLKATQPKFSGGIPTLGRNIINSFVYDMFKELYCPPGYEIISHEYMEYVERSSVNSYVMHDIVDKEREYSWEDDGLRTSQSIKEIKSQDDRWPYYQDPEFFEVLEATQTPMHWCKGFSHLCVVRKREEGKKETYVQRNERYKDELEFPRGRYLLALHKGIIMAMWRYFQARFDPDFGTYNRHPAFVAIPKLGGEHIHLATHIIIFTMCMCEYIMTRIHTQYQHMKHDMCSYEDEFPSKIQDIYNPCVYFLNDVQIPAEIREELASFIHFMGVYQFKNDDFLTKQVKQEAYIPPVLIGRYNIQNIKLLGDSNIKEEEEGEQMEE